MPNKLIIGTLLKFSKIKVVHSLPGRLRLKLPGLSKFKDEKLPDDRSSLIPWKLKGINTIDFNLLTSKVLITYDDKLTDENQILGWLNRLREIIVQKLLSNKDNKAPDVIKEIVEELNKDGYEMEKYG